MCMEPFVAKVGTAQISSLDLTKRIMFELVLAKYTNKNGENCSMINLVLN